MSTTVPIVVYGPRGRSVVGEAKIELVNDEYVVRSTLWKNDDVVNMINPTKDMKFSIGYDKTPTEIVPLRELFS
jgi:hypothetical protein